MEMHLEELESRVKFEPENLTVLTELTQIYTQLDRKRKAMDTAMEGLRIFQSVQLSASQGLAMVEVALELWKSEKYIKKGSLRLNMSTDRSDLLENVKETLTILARMRDPSVSQRVTFHLAYVKEVIGSFQDSLSLLSDLITAQASNGVELSFIIFRAAVLLKHMSGTNQALEYLEYLVDDPPDGEGYGKMHVLALLVLVYEQLGDKYAIALQRTYDELQEEYTKELTSGRRQQTNQRKIEQLFAEKGIRQSSEIWEHFALQSIDRSEFVLTAEFLQQAISRAPNKGRLLHLLSEVFCMLKEKDRAIKCAERAYVLQPQSAELKNLLLSLDPAKWKKKMRTTPTSKDLRGSEEAETKQAQMQKLEGDRDDLDGKSSKSLSTGLMGKMVGKKKAKERNASPEARAKEMADAQSRAQKQKDKKAQEKKRVEEKLMSAISKSTGKVSRNFIDRNGGPAKPTKPIASKQSTELLSRILRGDENMHLYEPILIALAATRRQFVEQEAVDLVQNASRAQDENPPRSKNSKGRNRKR
jgi:tetratricopeptide (TPR) repeat protein